MRKVGYLVILLAQFTVAVTSALAQNQGHKPNWKDVEADNGAVYKVDLNSVFQPNNGTASIVVYVVSNSGFSPENMHRLSFDCHGQFQDITGPNIGPMMDIPPRSIASRVSSIACVGAKDLRLENVTRPEPKDTPTRYCTGFSPTECARIVAAVNSKQKPSYCKPGFGLVGSGLTPEQRQICRVISSEDIRLESARNNITYYDGSKNRSFNLTLSATKGEFPNVIGATNFPDGTKLLIEIKKPRLPNARELLADGKAMCEDNCLPATDEKRNMFGPLVNVLAGAFSAGPLSWNGKPIKPGTYDVDVYLADLPGDTSPEIGRMKRPVLTTSVTMLP